MPPCGPHLTPLATGSLERRLLVLSTPGGLTGDDLSRLFFACTNTSHAQSCRNLHHQYLAKNQSTQCCQSLITQGSDHPPVLEQHMVLNLPLYECIDNTHTEVTRRKRKRKETSKKKLQQAIESQQKDHLKRTSLGPLTQGQRLDTSETKHSSSKEHKAPNQSSKNHKELPGTHASSP
jgi:hypothetical protein